MHESRPGQRLRVFIGERDRHGRRPLAEVLVEEAHRRGLAGATVLKGVAGFGVHSRVHTAKILRLSESLPLIVEIVDTAERLDEYLAWLTTVMAEGTITREEVEVLFFRSEESETAEETGGEPDASGDAPERGDDPRS
jgi:PII-like signaling protein